MRSAHTAPHLPRPGPPPACRGLIIAGSTQSVHVDREMSALGTDQEPDNDRAYTPPTTPIEGLFYLTSHATLNTVRPATGDVVVVGTEGVEEHTCQQGPFCRGSVRDRGVRKLKRARVVDKHGRNQDEKNQDEKQLSPQRKREW